MWEFPYRTSSRALDQQPTSSRSYRVAAARALFASCPPRQVHGQPNRWPFSFHRDSMRLRGIGNRLRAGGGGALPPTADMVAWFRKGLGITDASGAVSAWADQSGNGRNYIQATGANQPALQAGGSILFDGVSDFLKTAGFTLAQPYARCLRVKQKTWTSGDYWIDGASLNSGVIIQTGATPSVSIYAGSATVAANTAAPVDAWVSVIVCFNGASSFIRVGATTTTGNPGASAAGGLTLGASGTPGGSQYGNIEVAEEIVYSVAPDSATQDAIIAYLDTK